MLCCQGRRKMNSTAQLLRQNNAISLVLPMQLLPRITFTMQRKQFSNWQWILSGSWWSHAIWEKGLEIKFPSRGHVGDLQAMFVMEILTRARWSKGSLKVNMWWRCTKRWTLRYTEGADEEAQMSSDRQGRRQTGNRTCLSVAGHVWVLLLEQTAASNGLKRSQEDEPGSEIKVKQLVLITGVRRQKKNQRHMQGLVKDLVGWRWHQE